MDEAAAELAPTTAERIAQNDHTFREANEQIRESAERYAFGAPVPFICECADPTCTEIIRVELDAYADVRTNARRFLNAPGHHVAAQGYAEVVETMDGYVIVEKVGRAGDVAEELGREDA